MSRRPRRSRRERRIEGAADRFVERGLRAISATPRSSATDARRSPPASPRAAGSSTASPRRRRVTHAKHGARAAASSSPRARSSRARQSVLAEAAVIGDEALAPGRRRAAAGNQPRDGARRSAIFGPPRTKAWTGCETRSARACGLPRRRRAAARGAEGRLSPPSRRAPVGEDTESRRQARVGSAPLRSRRHGATPPETPHASASKAPSAHARDRARTSCVGAAPRRGTKVEAGGTPRATCGTAAHEDRAAPPASRVHARRREGRGGDKFPSAPALRRTAIAARRRARGALAARAPPTQPTRTCRTGARAFAKFARERAAARTAWLRVADRRRRGGGVSRGASARRPCPRPAALRVQHGARRARGGRGRVRGDAPRMRTARALARRRLGRGGGVGRGRRRAGRAAPRRGS